MQTFYPCLIRFSGGVIAEAVPPPNGTRHDGPPAYTIAGQPVDLDPTIPADIAAAGWEWHGGWLFCRLGPDAAGISIACARDMEEYWTIARRYIAKSAELAGRIATKETRRATPQARPAGPREPVQAVMELV